MRAHIIDNGVIANTIEVESLGFMPGLIEAVGDEGIGWSYDGATFSPPAPVVTPKVIPPVSPRQIRQALSRVNLRNAVETTVSVADRDTKDWWEFATSFDRNHPQVLAMGVALGQSEKQLDDLFILAGSL